MHRVFAAAMFFDGVFVTVIYYSKTLFLGIRSVNTIICTLKIVSVTFCLSGRL